LIDLLPFATTLLYIHFTFRLISEGTVVLSGKTLNLVPRFAENSTCSISLYPARSSAKICCVCKATRSVLCFQKRKIYKTAYISFWKSQYTFAPGIRGGMHCTVCWGSI